MVEFVTTSNATEATLVTVEYLLLLRGIVEEIALIAKI
jgi:hypothetical protein